ncbi:GtrA family protein [Parabacteroides provencensis]|uniref:GtrA family protein n=1 Tax=Parabacteroides provencensis TaxID=1944636 RepID=UPI000C158BB4
MIRKHWKRFRGFSLVGVGITFFSFFLLFNEILHANPYIAYVVAYIYILNAKIVYKTSLEKKDMLKYRLIYISSMILGTVILWIYLQLFSSINETILSVAVLPVTMLWNYFFVNKMLTKKKVEYAG